MGKMIAIGNQKGGVGKTTTTVNLGAALASLGKKVLIIDSDSQGNATSGLGVERTHEQTSFYEVLIDQIPIQESPVGAVPLKSTYKLDCGNRPDSTRYTSTVLLRNTVV